jgi:uncharacterized membrane protein
MNNALPGTICGVFTILLSVLCFVFNRNVGGWLRRFPLAVFGLKEKVAADEIIFRGLACLLGLLYAGIGLILLIPTFK